MASSACRIPATDTPGRTTDCACPGPVLRWAAGDFWAARHNSTTGCRRTWRDFPYLSLADTWNVTYVETWARELIPSLKCTCRFYCACSLLGICMVVCYFVSVVNVLSLSHVLSLLTRGHNSHEPIVEGLNIRLCLCLCQKFPIVFWESFGVKKLPEYLSIKQKNKINGTSSTFGATRI